MTDPHHHAAGYDEGRRRETELLGTEKRGDHDVATRLELTIDLDGDAVAQTVEQQRLLRLGETELPRSTGVLEAGERGRTGATVMPRDEDDIRMRLAHARGHSA